MFEAIGNFFKFLTGLGDNSTGNAVLISVITVLLIVAVAGLAFLRYKKKFRIWILNKTDEANFFVNGSLPKYDKKFEEIEERIDIMDKDIADNKEHLLVINDKIDSLIDTVAVFIKDSEKRSQVTFRNSLWQMYKEFMRQGSVSESGLKNFNDMVDEYEKIGGNDIVHDKLKPDIMKLKIDDRDLNF